MNNNMGKFYSQGCGSGSKTGSDTKLLTNFKRLFKIDVCIVSAIASSERKSLEMAIDNHTEKKKLHTAVAALGTSID
jgi:hypothetical protein